MTIAIPIFGKRISPRLDLAENLKLFYVKGNKILKSEVIRLISHNKLEKINMVIGLNPDVIICNGLSEIFEKEIEKNNIKLISWIHGEVSEVLNKYLLGKLTSQQKSLTPKKTIDKK